MTQKLEIGIQMFPNYIYLDTWQRVEIPCTVDLKDMNEWAKNLVAPENVSNYILLVDSLPCRRPNKYVVFFASAELATLWILRWMA